MKRLFFHLFVCCTLILVAGKLGAAPVTFQQARAQAESFLKKKARDLENPTSMHAQGQAGTETDGPFYVFNAQGGGFVVVAADDVAAPILGYVERGTYDAGNLPEGLQWLLQLYADQIGSLRRSPLEARHESQAKVLAQTVPVRHHIEPLLSTCWNQGEPYNLLCPHYYNQDGTLGDLCATGCVATAVAQVMAYYKYPNATLRTIPGYLQHFETAQGDKNVQLRNVPSHSVIDWDNMLDSYDGDETEAQQMAVAQLMYWVGLGCKMGYGPSSAAGFPNAVDALVRYFGYDDGTHIESRHKHSLNSWTNLLYDELASGHPIAFAGTNTGGAHAFVLDGYDVDGLFHVNWGWGGMNNGYFRIDVLDPDDNSGIGASPLPGGYNMGQEAIIGMDLPDDTTSPAEGYKLTVNDWELRGENTFFANYVNWSGVDADWNIGIGSVADDGTITLVGSPATVRINQNFYSSNEFVVGGLGEGSYRIVPVSKRTVDQQWQTHVNPFINYVQADVSADGRVALAIHPLEEVELTEISFPGNHRRGQAQKVCGSFRNHGEEYYHEVFLFASRNSDKGTPICRTAVTIVAGGESTASFSFTPQQTGNWTVWLAADDGCRQILGQASVQITEQGVQTTENLRYVSTSVSNRSNGVILGNCIQGKVSVLNQGQQNFDGRLRLWLFKLEDDGLYYGQSRVYVPLRAEAGKVAQAGFLFDHLQIDAQYALAVQYEQGEDIPEQGLKILGRTQKGVICWMADHTLRGLQPAALVNTPANAMAVDLSLLGDYVSTVHPNSNPNTLYILSEGATVPDGLEGANVVVGNHADELHLNEGWGFMSPIRFTAGVASFRCELHTGKWQTIALPFTPDFLPQGVQVMEFSAVDETGNPVFRTSDSITRNIPCLYRSDADGNLHFEATDITISETNNAPMVAKAGEYCFWGTTVSKDFPQALVLNDEGSAFECSEAPVTAAPFTACFLAPEEVSGISVPQAIDDGIWHTTVNDTDSTHAYFNLSGQRVITPRRGIYIVNHKKVVVW